MRLDQPGLNCQTCRTSFERGNAATPEGLTVYDGLDPDEFQCADCPLRLSGPLDETSHLALAVWNALAPLPEGTTTIETVFRVMDIPYPSRLASEVYWRVCEIARASHELEAKRAKATRENRNGHHGSTEDLLAGANLGEDEE